LNKLSESEHEEEGFGSDMEVEVEKKKSKGKTPKEEKKQFEEVPAEKAYSDMDSDEIAEIWAIAKHMLWKKEREELIDKSYNRYSFFDDDANLPEWFVENEAKAYVANLPITKDEVLQEK